MISYLKTKSIQPCDISRPEVFEIKASSENFYLTNLTNYFFFKYCSFTGLFWVYFLFLFFYSHFSMSICLLVFFIRTYLYIVFCCNYVFLKLQQLFTSKQQNVSDIFTSTYYVFALQSFYYTVLQIRFFISSSTVQYDLSRV